MTQEDDDRTIEAMLDAWQRNNPNEVPTKGLALIESLNTEDGLRRIFMVTTENTPWDMLGMLAYGDTIYRKTLADAPTDGSYDDD